MALIKCQECGKEISDTSKKCIHCGAKIKKEKNEEIKKNKKKTILIILSVFLFIGIILTISFFLKSDVEQTNLRDDTKNQIEIITDYINIREMQDVSSDILGKVYRGEIYTILSENTDSKYKWLEIETSNGIRGYISGIEDYVKRLNIENNENNQNLTDTPTIDNDGNTFNNENNNSNNDTKPNNDTDNNVINNEENNNNNNVPTKETIILKNIWMENAGGTFSIGDTITIHATVESQYKIKSGVVWLQSKVNNQSIKSISTYIGEDINSSDIIMKGIITDDMLPGLWEYDWSYFDNQYGIYINDWQTGRFQFTIV